jgi:hypothetical protein
MVRFCAALVFGLVLCFTNARADFSSGDQLFQRCTSQDGQQTLLCLGYVAGVADTLALDKHICIPTTVTVDQVEAVVVKYLSDNPQSRQYGASSEAEIALVASFPCKQ